MTYYSLTPEEQARIREINEQIQRDRGILIDYRIAEALANAFLRVAEFDHGNYITGWDEFREAMKGVAEYHGKRDQPE